METDGALRIAASGVALVLAVLVAARARRGPLTFPLALLFLDIGLWSLAELGRSLSTNPAWAWLDVACSAWVLPLSFHIVAVFVGARRRLAAVGAAFYGAAALLSTAALLSFVSPAARGLVGSPSFAALQLALVGVGLSIGSWLL